MTRYWWFNERDLAFIAKCRGKINRFGMAVQLCYLRYPGRNLEPKEVVPPLLLNYVAGQLGIKAAVFEQYALERPPTRYDHLAQLSKEYGYESFKSQHYQTLLEWLSPKALQIDQPLPLMADLVAELRLRRILQPAMYQLEKLVWEVLQQAQERLYDQLTGSLTGEQQEKLDKLLKVGRDKRMSDLSWLRQPTGKNSPASFNKLVERLEFIRELKLEAGLAKTVNPARLVQLALNARRMRLIQFSQLSAKPRYALLVALLLELSQKLTDQALEMHNNLIGQLFN
jgi:TnpA family transposase